MQYTVSRLWRRDRPNISLRVEDAVLEFWQGLFCCRFELRGSRLRALAMNRGSRRLRPPSWIRMKRVTRPPIRWNLRATPSNVLNVLLLGIAMVAVRDVAGLISAVVFLSAAAGILSSLAAVLVGAPRIAVTHVEHTPSVPLAG